jgi:hypothetical protein
METLNAFKLAASSVQPYVPLFQVSSSSVSIIPWIWRSTPTAVKLIAFVVIVGLVIMVVLKVRKEISRAKESFHQDPFAKKQYIPSEYLRTQVDELLSKSRRLAKQGTHLYNQGDETGGFEASLAAATYLSIAKAIMPNVCKQSVPEADKSIKKINKMLETRLKRFRRNEQCTLQFILVARARPAFFDAQVWSELVWMFFLLGIRHARLLANCSAGPQS